MYSLNDINERVAETSKKSHGLHVFNRLEEVRKEGGEKHRSRWFWELLQNAKDAVEANQAVDICVEITDEHVRFKHTGNPFKLDEIIQLIVQGSTKSEQENKTGRFGTGFISTYILSEKVQIEGVLNDNTKFDFVLDREAEDEEEFLEKQEKCIEKFQQSLTDIEPLSKDKRETIFTYPLKENKKRIAESGLGKIEKYLPFVLAFNKKLNRISISKDGNVQHYSKSNGQNYQALDETIQPNIISISESNGPIKRIIVGLIQKDDYDIAILLEEKNGDLGLIHLDDKYPKFYYAFPLLETGDYGIPIVINSEKFSLKTERNDIFLGKNLQQDPDIYLNKKTIEKAIELIPNYINWANHLGTKNIAYIYDFKKVNKNGLDEDWLNQKKCEGINLIKKTPAFNINNELKSLVDFKVPANPNDEVREVLHNLLNDFKGYYLPLKHMTDYWYEMISNHATLLGQNIQNLNYAFGITHLAGKIEDLGTLDNLRSALSFDNKDRKVFDWLNDFYSLVNQYSQDLFNINAILLNQNDQFIKRTPKLKIDKIRDDSLIKVDILLGNDIRSELIHRQLQLPSQVCNPIEQKEYLDSIIPKVNDRSEDEYSETDVKANALLMKWLLDNKAYFERLKSFQVLTLKNDESLNKEVFPIHKKHKLLAPKKTWKDRFPIYSELIRSDHCMHDTYADYLTEEDFSELEKQEFIHRTPLVRRKETVRREDLKKLMKNPNNSSFLDTDQEDYKIGEIVYWDFAYFVSSENSILDNQSLSKTKKLLKFVLTEAPYVDEKFNVTNKIKFSDNNTLEVRRSIWPGRLRETQWVYVKSDTDDSNFNYSSETPSSKNLADLIKEDEKLREAIRGDKAATVLGILGISVADLLRSSLKNEEEQLQWDKAFTHLLTSGMSASEAVSLITDPETVANFRERKEKKKQLEANQSTGNNFEKVFEKIIKSYSPELEIRREPWGSDYIIEHDFINPETDNEEVFNIDGHYVELKATGKDYAAMTPLQVETAVKQQEHYSLVVLELDGVVINEEAILQNTYVISNVGYLLEKKYASLLKIKGVEDEVQEDSGDIQIVMQPGEVRFHIQKKLWRTGRSLEDFIQNLINTNSP